MVDVKIDEINKLVGLHLGKRNVTARDRLMEDLNAESADVAIIIAVIEEKYGIVIKESEIATIYTSQDLFELVTRKMT